MRDMIVAVAESERATEMRLHLEKILAVSSERVFAAFVDANHLRRWWGPAGFTIPRLEFDATEGGHYRIGRQSKDGNLFHIIGTFHGVELPVRLRVGFIYY